MGDTEPTAAEKFMHDDELVVRRFGATKWLWLVGVIVLAAITTWWITHPYGFARRGVYDGQAPAGQPLFIAVLGPSSDSARDLDLKDVKARVESAPDGTETAVLICRGGAIATTSDAQAFCGELVDANGETFHYGDNAMEQLVLRVTSSTAGTVVVDGVSITFREGLQFGTETVGPKVTLTVLAR